MSDLKVLTEAEIELRLLRLENAIERLVMAMGAVIGGMEAAAKLGTAKMTDADNNYSVKLESDSE